MQVLNLFDPLVLISDPDVVKDMLVTKNGQIDKPDGFYYALSNLFGKAFVFAPTDENWRRKRKGIAHCFFKDKLTVMLEFLKAYAMQAQQRWLDEIKASKDGST